MASDNSPPASFFDGFDQIINDALQSTPGFDAKNTAHCNAQISRGCSDTFGEEAVFGVFQQMERNWSNRVPPKRESQENWREVCKIDMSAHNPNPEQLLEYGIANLAQLNVLGEWYNQVPVASGYVGSNGNRRSNLDLVHIEGDDATLVELKWASDTPLAALLQVFRYGMSLFFTRVNPELAAMYRTRKLIRAPSVKLAVLAPTIFYQKCEASSMDPDTEELAQRCDCRPFAMALSEGLKALRDEHPRVPEVKFSFQKFPNDFRHPFTSGDDMRLMRIGKAEDVKRRMCDAMNSIETLWEI